MAKHNEEHAEAVVADAQETMTAASETGADAAATVAAAQAAADAVDPDLAAFEAAEREYPELFANARAEANTAREAAAQAAAEASAASEAATAAEDAAAAAETAATVALGAGKPAQSHESLATAVTQAYAPAEPTQVLPAEPVRDVTPVPSYPAPQSPILVPAPEPPQIRGNRSTIALIGLVAALTFVAIYFVVSYLSHLVAGTATINGFVSFALERATSFTFWLPTIAFFLGFWFLGVFVNRAKWGRWVFFSFIPGLFAWGGIALEALVANEFWKHSTDDMLKVANAAAFSLAGLAAFLIGREVTVWYGKWAARSGAKKIALYEVEEAEYERTIEAGPQL